MIDVRRATLADKPAIFRFLAKAYGEKARYKYPERWEWQFEQNPFRERDLLPIWIATDEAGNIVGQECVMMEPLQIGSETCRLGWSVDTFLLPEARGHKVGFRLFQAAFDHTDVLMGLRMTETSRHILSSLGCTPVEPVGFFSRVIRLDASYVLTALRERLGNRRSGRIVLSSLQRLRLDHLIAVLVNAWIRLRDRSRPGQSGTGIVIRQVERFDHGADELWDLVSPRLGVAVQRTSEFLNWKYVRQPHTNYQLFTASSGGKMCGYIVLRTARPPESNSGIVADLLVSQEDEAVLHSLLAFAVRHFESQNVGRISAASSSGVYQRALLALGFRRKGDWDFTPMFHRRTEIPTVESTPASGGWFFGRSDSDSDQFPYE